MRLLPLTLLFCLSQFVSQAEIKFSKPFYTIEKEELSIGNMFAWQTSVEKGNIEFFVQRSINGGTFETVSQPIAKKDQVGKNDYFFLDIKTVDKAYYRLKIKDNGVVLYSNPIYLEREKENSIYISEINTPEIDQVLKIKYQSGADLEMAYEVLDMNQKQIFSDRIFAQKGENNFILGFENKPIGNYTLRLINGQEVDEITLRKVGKSSKPKSGKI